MLKIYNSLTRQITPFKPLIDGTVRMYVCGITVYDRCHIGHARMMVNFDIVYRWLKQLGYDVTYVRNITDIDDKIIDRAIKNKESIDSLTSRMIAAMHADLALLKVSEPSFEPRATDYIDDMLSLIAILIKKGLAYQGEQGDVYYSVRDFPEYGRLSGKSLDDLRAGERIQVNTQKRDPLDFVLWKSAKPDEPKWPSPWGEGRPGWHIECSAMSAHFLGNHFDIHGGGHDLQFPHHENEIAQSEGAHGHPLAQVWMHNGFLQVHDEKMSKSLGNFLTIEDIIKNIDAEVLRFFLLRGHYRSPLNFSEAQMEDARQSLNTLYSALRPFEVLPEAAINWQGEIASTFAKAMNDDFGTPEAIAVLFSLAHEINRSGSRELAILLKGLGGVLGLLWQNPEQWARSGQGLRILESQGVISDIEVQKWIQKRIESRQNKRFAESDRIRAQLLEQGIALEDTPNGTQWHRVDKQS